MRPTIPLKRLVDPGRPITYGIVQAGEDVVDGVPYIRPVDMDGHRGVNPSSLRTTSPEIAAAYTRSALRPGDVVVSIGPSFGKTMLVPDELDGANLTQGTARVAVRPDVDARYIVWALQAQTAVDFWETSIGGATFRALNLGPLAATPIPMHLREEQRAIADYLNRETARIDTLIDEQQRLIEMLRERRDGVVAHVMLDAPVKRTALRRVVDVIDCAHVTATFVDDDARYPVASIRECQGAIVDLSECNYTTPEFFEHLRASNRAPRVGDLLFVRNVSVGLVAAVAPGTPEFAVGQETVLLRRKTDVDPAFLRYALTAAETRQVIEAAMIGSTFRRINVSAIRGLMVPLPAPKEQHRIAAYLDEQTAKIDVLIAETERFIELARERRSALITAAVTGQIDVRAVA